MNSPKTLSFSNLQTERRSKPSPPTSDLTSEPMSPSQNPPPRKIRTSAQLNRWSRARTVRSGRKLDRPVQKITAAAAAAAGRSLLRTYSNTSSKTTKRETEPDEESGGINGMEETEVTAGGKSIYMVSDGTGWTVEHSVYAALHQFEHCLVDRVCPVYTHLFSGIDDVDRLMEVIKQAAKEGALLVYTLADPSMVESARQACQLWGIQSADILGPITEAMASHLGVTPSGLAHWAPGRSSSLTADYFRRIDAIEFTIKQDDGALPQNLHRADIVLAGVSRTGKTPLSTYLAHKGYKVANVPIVMNVDLPSTLFEIDPEKVFGLTINAVILQTIRRARARSLGFGEELRTNYSEIDYVKEELQYASRIFAQNPVWPVIEVTGKAIEETAAIVLRLFHERKNKGSVPRISKRY